VHCLILVEVFHLNSIFFIIASMTIIKNVAVKGSPCFTPVWNSNFQANSLFIFTIALFPKSVNTINFINFDGILYSFKRSITLFLLLESKACR